MNHNRALLAAVFVLSVRAVWAQDDFKAKANLSQLKAKGAADAEKTGPIAAKPVPFDVGEKDAALSRQMVQEAAALVVKNAKDIVHFVNDKGCVPNGGKNVPLNEAAVKRVAQATADKTEVLFNVGQGMMTRLTGQSQAWAVAIAAEVKPAVEKSQVLKLGTPGKNTVVLKVKPSGGGPRFAHEFLHLVLRQFDNPALGGGRNKSKICKFIADTHHELTDYLSGHTEAATPAANVDPGWSQYKQSPTAWAPSSGDPACQAPDLSEAEKKCDEEQPK